MLVIMLKYLFFLLIIRPFIFLVLGVNVRNLKTLPQDGPAIIVANHNSHIDTLLLISLFSVNKINKIRPVAAADYFCNTKFKKFFFEKLIGIIPIERKISKENISSLFDGIFKALDNNEIIIIYPEGTRGNDNKISEFKSGVAHIAKAYPNVPVIPIFINGPDKILPKIDAILVPFISDVYIGEPMFYNNKSTLNFTKEIKEKVFELKALHTKKETL